MRPALRDDMLAPYMALWLEMTARSARGDAPGQRVAAAIAGGFAAWLAERLERAADAPRLLALIEGIALLDAIDRPALADAAAVQPA